MPVPEVFDELDDVVGQAAKLTFEASLTTATGAKMTIEAGAFGGSFEIRAYPMGGSYRWGTHLETGITYDDPSFNGSTGSLDLFENHRKFEYFRIRMYKFGEAMREMGRLFPMSELQLDTIKVKSEKSPVSGRKLKALVVRGLCKSLGVDTAGDKEIARAKASRRASSRKQAALVAADLRNGKTRNWRSHFKKSDGRPRLNEIDLSGAELVSVNFSEVDLSQCNFEKARLVRPDFSKSKLSEATFSRTVFEGGSLDHATLTRASFASARLQGDPKKPLTMRKASLKGATFKNARLKNVDLSGADLRGADFRSAKFESVAFKKAIFNESTRWPRAFRDSLLSWSGKGPNPFLDEGKARRTRVTRAGFREFITKDIFPQRQVLVDWMIREGHLEKLAYEVSRDEAVAVVDGNRCRLSSDGEIACFTASGSHCMSLTRGTCKHLLILLIAAVEDGKLGPTKAAQWERQASGTRPPTGKRAFNQLVERTKGFKTRRGKK
ncbi:MAG: pentapeptide repeat-containing protein [Planctomycetota bacterium]